MVQKDLNFCFDHLDCFYAIIQDLGTIGSVLIGKHFGYGTKAGHNLIQKTLFLGNNPGMQNYGMLSCELVDF